MNLKILKPSGYDFTTFKTTKPHQVKLLKIKEVLCLLNTCKKQKKQHHFIVFYFFY